MAVNRFIFQLPLVLFAAVRMYLSNFRHHTNQYGRVVREIFNWLLNSKDNGL